MEKATYTYASGHMVKFPAHSAGPRLFLEWLAEYQCNQYKMKLPDLKFQVRMVTAPNEVLHDVVVIRDLFPMQREEVKALVKYLNDNMG